MSNVELHITEINDSLKFAGFNSSIEQAIEVVFNFMFPGYFYPNSNCNVAKDDVKKIFNKCFSYVFDNQDEIDSKFKLFFDNFDEIKASIICDIDAAYRGDPACKNYDEIILAYPCFRAISAYRFAHVLYELDIPIIPRAIGEYMHSLTGIDIHPGATIGKSFFIDHGTGVVIGETCIIGDNVTLYQNVTLGAKSFPHDDEGSLIKGIKRHPNIGSNVVIYAGATILGDINIGDNCVIGGNVWLIDSIPAGTKYLK